MSVPFRLSRYSIDGSHLTVCSAYGSRRAVLGIMKRKGLGRGLFHAILRDTVSIVPPVAVAGVVNFDKSRQASRLPL